MPLKRIFFVSKGKAKPKKKAKQRIYVNRYCQSCKKVTSWEDERCLECE